LQFKVCISNEAGSGEPNPGLLPEKGWNYGVINKGKSQPCEVGGVPINEVAMSGDTQTETQTKPPVEKSNLIGSSP
jgi:hypothetical protein